MLHLAVPINHLAIIGATIAAFLLGALWYSPLLFGNPWFESRGILPKKTAAEAARVKNPTTHLIATALMLIVAYVLNLFLRWLQVTTITDALSVGFFVWLGFMVTIGFINAIYENRSLSLFAVHSIYCLAYLELMAVVLTLWR